MFTAFLADTRWSDLHPTETLTSRTAADETASTSTASASRSQRTARERLDLSSVGRSLCTQLPHRLLLRMLAQSAMRRTRRLEACFTSFRGQRHQGYRDDGCLPGNIRVRGRLLQSGRFYSSSIRKAWIPTRQIAGFQVHQAPLRLTRQTLVTAVVGGKLTEVIPPRGRWRIDWLAAQFAISVSKDRHDCDEQKPRAKQEQTESGATNLSDCDAAFVRLNRKCEV